MILIRPGHSGPTERGAQYDGHDEDRIALEVAVALHLLTGCRLLAAPRGEVASLLGDLADPACCLEVHCNAGRGDYALVCWHPGSVDGETLAREVARAYREMLDPLSIPVRCEPADERWPRVATCLRPYYSLPGRRTGILIELGFLDTVRHAHLWADTEALALALSNARIAW